MGAAEWTGYSSPTVTSSYPATFQSSYDQSSMLPAVLPNDGLSYNPSDYHCGSSSAQNASYGTTAAAAQFTSLAPWSNEVDQYNYGYNTYQYPCQPTVPPTQPPYSQPPPPPTAPSQTTMVLYPQLYSTVNQNQIHLHLHGSDKLVEQYLGGAASGMQPPDNSFALSNPLLANNNNTLNHNQRAIGGLELPMLPQSEELKHQEHTVVDQDVVDQNVWRPY